MPRRSVILLTAGFLLSVAAFISYFNFFVRWPVTRDVPWVSYILFAVAMVMLAVGFRAARRKVIAGIVTLLGVGILAFFIVTVTVGSRKLPSAAGAPRVGQKAPEFALLNTSRKSVALSQLLASSPRGVLLIFYRGYW